MERLLYGIEEAADVIGLSPHTIRAYERQGLIKGTRIGTRVLIPVSELERLAEEGSPSPHKEKVN
jgi:excisionase family DNA binding protein